LYPNNSNVSHADLVGCALLVVVPVRVTRCQQAAGGWVSQVTDGCLTARDLTVAPAGADAAAPEITIICAQPSARAAPLSAAHGQYCRDVRFEQRLRDGIHSGAVVLAFRRWKRSQVVPGRRYRTGIDMVEVESVDVVEPALVDAAQAREAGYTSVGELLADLRGDPALPVYRIRLRRIDGPDPRDELASAARLTEADVAAITARLARMVKQPRAVDRHGARADR